MVALYRGIKTLDREKLNLFFFLGPQKPDVKSIELEIDLRFLSNINMKIIIILVAAHVKCYP